ncbi:hypothetical protein KCU99_g163, partial [Aureobasidium melanogenum]
MLKRWWSIVLDAGRLVDDEDGRTITDCSWLRAYVVAAYLLAILNLRTVLYSLLRIVDRVEGVSRLRRWPGMDSFSSFFLTDSCILQLFVRFLVDLVGWAHKSSFDICAGSSFGATAYTSLRYGDIVRHGDHRGEYWCEASQEKKLVGTVVFSRSFGVHVWICLSRFVLSGCMYALFFIQIQLFNGFVLRYKGATGETFTIDRIETLLAVWYGGKSLALSKW